LNDLSLSGPFLGNPDSPPKTIPQTVRYFSHLKTALTRAERPNSDVTGRDLAYPTISFSNEIGTLGRPPPPVTPCEIPFSTPIVSSIVSSDRTRLICGTERSNKENLCLSCWEFIPAESMHLIVNRRYIRLAESFKRLPTLRFKGGPVGSGFASASRASRGAPHSGKGRL
jgi:hypothetical protein